MEALHVQTDVDGFKITLETVDPDMIKNYAAQIIEMMREHIQTISRGRIMTESMMVQQMQNARSEPQKQPILDQK